MTGYQTLEVDFWFKMVSMETNENFFVQFFDGTTWQTVANIVRAGSIVNNTFYHQVVTISSSSYTFPTNAKIRFMCDASDNNDDVYVDEIEFRGLTGTALAKGSNSSSVAAALPESFELMQNYPNPFSANGTFGNPSTTISFALPSEAQVKLTVHDLLGREIAQLVNGPKPAGRHEVLFDGRDLTSGVYYYRIEVESSAEARRFVEVKKMAFVK